MPRVPRVTAQAGVGGAELQQLGAQARYVQDAIGQDGAPVKAVAGAKASGTITISSYGDLTANDTVTVGETIITFVDADPAELEVEIGEDAGGTRDNLLAVLEMIAADEGVVVATSSAAAITVTALAQGVAGNAIVLAKSGDGVTAPGILSGGVDTVLGTVSPAGGIRTDGTDAWIALTATTETDTTGWKKLTVGGGL